MKVNQAKPACTHSGCKASGWMHRRYTTAQGIDRYIPKRSILDVFYIWGEFVNF